MIPDSDTVKNSFELRLEVNAEAPVDQNDSHCVGRSIETVFGYSVLEMTSCTSQGFVASF